jgi:SpoVK/Ycf46/Vps4 family AAA+-type ATPase
MENLNGILIATTNLSNNLDKAFERRFLYKIKFQKPNENAQKSIWKSMLSDLDDETIAELASKYDFTGGQIENIARKKTVKSILDGEQISLAQLREFCDVEKLDKKERKVVGFGRQ